MAEPAINLYVPAGHTGNLGGISGHGIKGSGIRAQSPLNKPPSPFGFSLDDCPDFVPGAASISEQKFIEGLCPLIW